MEQLGSYRILSEIGRGGMAVVYKAIQPSLDRHVALKALPRSYSSDPEFSARFKQEALAAASLTHPNIVTIYDAGEADGVPFIVMELVDGPALTALLSSGPLRPAQVRDIAGQVASALSYAHARGIVHRDIKPGNILVDAWGRAKLTDFGIACVTAGSRLTRTGVSVGTPEYMAPEQVTGAGVDARSDIYAFGVVMYEMLTGRLPFSGDNPLSVAFAQVNQAPLPPRSIDPSIPGWLEAVVLKCMAKRPEERFQDMDQLRQALTAQQLGSVQRETTFVPKRGRLAGAAQPEPPGSRTAPRQRQLPGLEPQPQPAPPPGRRSAGLWTLLLILALLAATSYMGVKLVRFPGGPVVEPGPGKGLAVFVSQPPGASVVIDGEPRGVTPLQLELAVGKYNLVFRLAGFTEVRRTLEVDDRSRAVQVDVTLVVAQWGVLEIASVPPGAEVWVDGQLKGTTPCTLRDVAAGERQVTLRLLGYRSATTVVRLAAGETLPLNLSLAAAHPWGTFGLDAGNTRTSDEPAPVVLAELWRLAGFGPIEQSPVTHANLLYVADTAGGVWAVDLSSATVTWRQAVPAPAGGLAVSVQAVLAGGGTGLTAFEPATGRPIWQFPIPGGSAAPPKPVGDLWLAGGADGRLYALTSAGREAWKFQTGLDVTGSAALDGERVYFGSMDRRLYALSEDGAFLWMYVTGDAVTASPAVRDGLVYVTSRDGHLYCVDAASGVLKWRFRAGPRLDASPAVTGYVTVVASRDGSVYGIANDGKQVWRYQTAGEVLASPAVAGNTVYIPSGDGWLYVLELQSGTLLNRYELGAAVTASPVVVGGRVYVATSDGTLICFGPQ